MVKRDLVREMVRVPRHSSAFRELSVRGCRDEVDGLLASWEAGDATFSIRHEVEVSVTSTAATSNTNGRDGDEGVEEDGRVGDGPDSIQDEVFCGKVWVCGVEFERCCELVNRDT
jgi:hypothetical protein